MANYFGIDFGTTNCAVVRYDSRLERFYDIGDDDGSPLPSVVAIDNLTQNVTAGRKVKQNIVPLRESGMHLVVESVKTVLDRDDFWVTPARIWRALDIATELFIALSRRTEAASGEQIREAVVAIPIGMAPAKRAILRQAASRAGISVTAFISEPTAAFMVHASDLRHCKYVAVFDWGGGTLDVSVLETRSGCIIERYADGTDKAGDYIDMRMAEWVHSRIAAENPLNVSFERLEPNDKMRLLNACEACKRALQHEGVAEKTITLGRYAKLPLVEVRVTAEDFDALVTTVVRDALDRLLYCIAQSQLSQVEIGKLIVVGGSSHLLALQRELRRLWPQPNVLFPPDAEWDIAKGAAWLAAHPGSYRIADSIGLVLSNDEYHSIFPAGTRLRDAEFDLTLGLVEDSRTAVFDFATKNGTADIPTHIGGLNVPVFGFRDEVITLRCTVNEDLVFSGAAASESRAGDKREFLYDRLRWMYEEPQKGS